jgi:hypothetical protein
MSKGANKDEDSPYGGDREQGKANTGEWLVFLSSLWTPWVVLTALPSVVLLMAGSILQSKALAATFNIIASFLGAVAGGAFLNSYNQKTGNTLLLKKGRSAVRHLSLSRGKTDNILERMKANADKEELSNLAQLLGKDIEDSIQEWNDIVPGVDQIAFMFKQLGAKERELDELRTSQNDTEKQLQELDRRDKEHMAEKATLKYQLANDDMKIKELIGQIKLIRQGTANTTSTVTSSATAWSGVQGPAGPAYFTSGRATRVGGSMRFEHFCSNCGNRFWAKESGENLCEKCGSG